MKMEDNKPVLTKSKDGFDIYISSSTTIPNTFNVVIDTKDWFRSIKCLEGKVHGFHNVLNLLLNSDNQNLDEIMYTYF